MSRIYVLRHAKAANPFPGQKDFERPLTPTGLEAADRLGQWMADNDMRPEKIVCSPALRTRQTLQQIANHFSAAVEPEFDQALYSEDFDAYVDAARRVGNAASVLIVGHNPTCEEFAASLVVSGRADALDAMGPGMKPGAMAVIDLPGSLEEAGKKNGFLEAFIREGIA